MRLLIKNGLVIDPSRYFEEVSDVLIEDGQIAGVFPNIEIADAQIFDATGLVVAPGFIDLHTHLREPGREDKETIETGAKAAAAGGFTSICCMPNTQPINDNATVTHYILERAKKLNLVNIFPIGAITKQSEGQQLAEIGEMYEAGIVAISDDGRPVSNSLVMRRAMEYAKNFGLPVVDHCENKELAAGGVMNEGYYSTLLGLKGMSHLAEEADVQRDLMLAQETGAHIHIAHLSTAGSLALVKQGKQKGIKVTCEVTPHHFSLTDSAVEGFDTNTKMNPPLRTNQDVEALIQGIIDGTVDVIATDHAPHHADEKALEYDRAPFGIVGLETAVSLSLDKLYHTGKISLMRFVELLSTAPARVFNLARGTLAVGSPADITIFDPTLNTTVNPALFRSKSRNSPFAGWQLKGAVIATIVNGKIIYHHQQD
ncbi:MAG: dihydroorotase [Blastocatellia bacterium]|nr:dihydroorotase [Blastocatellia bacterium]